MCAEPQVWGDVVLARRDVPASYHVAVVVDDALQGVTDVARGMDLFQPTSARTSPVADFARTCQRPTGIIT